ncbi:hypothetical protein ABHQ57_06850 [Tenacibaculum sp. ZH5_bin.1]|uniref:hypothetical protein n=1 Tax=unclassified Tenacibaculum TaxID=2635139 RepID=UPI0036E53802
MKINIKTKELFTYTGVYIKKLECKYYVEKSYLTKTNNPLTIGNCDICQKEIYNTQNLTDHEVLQLVKENPDTFLYIDLTQENVSITMHRLSYFHELMGVSQIKCKDCNYKTDEFLVLLKFNVKDPHQCQKCGIISETSKEVCMHTDSLSKKAPLFCMECKSTNVEPIINYIG